VFWLEAESQNMTISCIIGVIECDVPPLVWIQCRIRVLVSHGGRSQDKERI